MTLRWGANGTTDTLEFTYRLTLGGASQVTSRLSRELGELVSETKIFEAITSGQIHLRILIHLLYQGIQGQHGVRNIEDAEELMAGQLNQINRVIIPAYTEVISLLFTEEDLAEIDDPAGKAEVPVDGTPG